MEICSDERTEVAPGHKQLKINGRAGLATFIEQVTFVLVLPIVTLTKLFNTMGYIYRKTSFGLREYIGWDLNWTTDVAQAQKFDYMTYQDSWSRYEFEEA